MGNEGNQAARDAAAVPPDDNHCEGQHGIARSIRPGTAVPSTVLVADLCNGGLLLHGWRDGTSAYLSPSDAPALRRELAAAFNSHEAARRRDQGDFL